MIDQRLLKKAAIIYSRGILLGLLLGFLFIKDLEQFMELGQNLYGDLLPFTTASYLILVLAIFQRNLLASMLTIGLGIAHSYLTMLILILNGSIFGIILYVVIFFNLNLLKLLALTLPHGVFEIPAFLLSGSLGIGLSQKENRFADRFLALKKSWPLMLIITALLLIAALIESLLIILIRLNFQ